MRLHLSSIVGLLLMAAPGGTHLLAADIGLSLNSASLPSQPVGTTTYWSARVFSGIAGLQYQFSILPLGGQASMVRSFHTSSYFEWTAMAEGAYQVIVDVRDGSGNMGEARSEFVVTSRLVLPDYPIISRTNHPLVALYSAPGCGTGTMRVAFYPAGTPAARQFTSSQSCVAGKSLNFQIAGMLPSTLYVMRYELYVPGQAVQFGPNMMFRTGTIPSSIAIPAATLIDPPNAQADASQPLLLTSYIAVQAGQSTNPSATDARGRVVWYYDGANKPLEYLLRPLSGGTMLVIPQDPSLLREIDMAGNTVRETNVGWISEQLQSRFGMQPITTFHHDAIRLPDGSIAAIASVEKIFNGIQGSTGPVDILGDAIVVMDSNFKVTWAWNSFDKLDVTRAAILGETCALVQPGCPPALLVPSIHQTAAHDWLHSNALAYLSDGSFLLSMRHQDWVIKIDYGNGSGTGNVLWRLGANGDFTMRSTEASPWFAHQHSVAMDGSTVWLFDNGNTRHAADPSADSRGQALQVEEAGRTVSLILNADLGAYSPALGSAQRLANGDFHYLAGDLTNGHSQSIEVSPTPSAAGTVNFLQDAANAAYRSFRMSDLYTP